MATVRTLLRGKDSTIHTIPASATALQAVHYMNQHRIGAVLVTEGDRLLGIFTERDVLRRVVEEERRPSQIPVTEVMTREVLCCSPDTSVEEVSLIMKDRRVRHLPVCAEGEKVVGVVSMGDLNAYHATLQEATIHSLHEYIYGHA